MRISHSTIKAPAVATLMLFLVSMLAQPSYPRERVPVVPHHLRTSPITSIAKADGPTQTRYSEAYGRLPLNFEANQGQFDSSVKYLSRASGHTIYLTSTEAVLCLSNSTAVAGDRQAVAVEAELASQQRFVGSSTVLRMKLIGAAPARIVDGIDELPGKSNYFIGNDPKNWRTGVKNFAKVRYRSVYPGIDLVFHSVARNLEYDFIVAPGANPAKIRVAFKGAERVIVDKNGDLVLKTAGGEISQQKPTVYQEFRGTRKQVFARFVKRGRDQVGFRVSRYDRRKPLVIDPVLLYSTYLGGSRLDNGQAVAVDNNGNAYVTGSTNSFDFPTANPFQGSLGGGLIASDVFVTKLNPTGTGLVYSTYIGGSSTDSGLGIALDSVGNAYITGQTSSPNFPTANPIQGTVAGLADAFLTKLNPQGSMLVYSTYLGGSQTDSGRAIAVDEFGAPHISGDTQSPNFPLANALRSTFAISEGFVSKFNSAGTALVYSTFLGGNGADSASAIALDSGGNAYVTGSTRSLDFPVINAIQPASADKTLFKSTDSGASWTVINNGAPNNESVLALAIDPLNTTTLYAGTLAGIYKSTDAGDHWLPATNGVANPTGVTVLAVDPLTPSIVYAATSTNIHKSTDGGDSWDDILDTTFNTSITIDPASPSTLYVGSQLQGVLVTTDGGATWEDTDVPFANSRVLCLALDPTHPGSFYAGTEFSGIHRYPAPCGPFPPVPVRCVTVNPASPTTVYAGTGSGAIYKTTDAGVNWKPTNTSGLGDLAIAVDPISPETVYAASRSQCYKSTDGGDSWSLIPINPQSATIAVNEIVIDPANTSTLYAAATAGGEAFVTKINATGGAYVYSTFIGGSGADSGADIAVDSSGYVYVAGTTNSFDIPSANSLRPFAGSSDLMITRITPDGGAMSFFSYFGGVFQETAAAIAIDSSGSVWVTGNTNSPNVPTTPDATPVNGVCESGSCRQAFVSNFSSDGALLAYSSYLGGNAPNPTAFSAASLGFGIAVDHSGSAYLVGQTFALDFPTTPGAFQINNGGGTSDAFVSKIGSPCGYSLSRTTQAFPPEGGSATFELTCALGCAWTVVPSDSWILLNSADAGTGGTTISIEVRENFDDRFRIGTLAIGGQTYTVLQEGLASVGCSNAISPTFGSFPSVGGDSSIDVIATEECIWEATSNVNWITITSSDTGIGIGAVSFHVDANPNAAGRAGTITIAGKTFSVKQKGSVGSGPQRPRKR